MVNLALRSIILVNPDLMDLECLENFWWIQAPESESGEPESLPNRPLISSHPELQIYQMIYPFQSSRGALRNGVLQTFI